VEELRKQLEQLQRERRQECERLENLERKVGILNDVFNDLKSVEREQETQLLMAQPLELHTEEEEEVYSRIGRLCWCCFCL